MNFLRKLLNRPPASARKLGRNDLCWCGSGKKYKKCHYSSDEKYFNARTMRDTCKGSG
jgi:hypothetical protein